VLIAGAALWYTQGRGGVQFILHNADISALDSVVLFAGGREYELSTVAAGDSAVVLVRTHGESHFELEHGLGDARKRVNLGGYFEEGYVGKYGVRMTRDTVLAVDSKITLPY